MPVTPTNQHRYETAIVKCGRYRIALRLAAVFGMLCAGQAADFKVAQDAASIQVATSHYILRIEKSGFRYSFSRPNDEIIAPAHPVSGLEFGGSDAVETKLRDSNDQSVRLEVSNAA